MQVRDVMERDMCVSHPGQSLGEAARLMLANDAAILPVVEEDDRLVGLIADRDIAVRARTEGRDAETLVAEVMSRDLKYCFGDDDVATVSARLGDQPVPRLPVLDRDHRLVGVLAMPVRAGRSARLAAALGAWGG